MLGIHIAALSNALTQIDGTLGLPIPSVTAAREALEHVKASTTAQELEERLEETYVAINAIAAGAQPAPNSLVANLLASIEQYKQARARVAAGERIAWACEHVSINGVVHEVMSGAWTIQKPQEAAIEKQRPARTKRPRVRA
jgi:hypothetical protein